MFNPIQLWRRGNGKAQRLQEIKGRIVKNEEVVLERMGKRAKGAKCCPFYLGATCVADACMFWMEFKNVNSQTGKEFTYWQCAMNKIPLLQIELIRDINLLMKESKLKEKEVQNE